MSLLRSPLFSILNRLVLIRPHERIKTLVMSFYFFSIIMTVWMLKPVRNSLFIDELGAGNLRYVYMGEGLFLIGVAWAFIQCAKRVSKKALYSGVLLFFIFCLIGFWFLFKEKIPLLSALFYIWGSSYSIVMTTQFFTLANDIFNPLEAKRLFGLILSAGSLGGVLGGVLTQELAGPLGTENLLLVIAGVIGFCQILMLMNWKHLTASSASAESEKKEKQEKSANPAKTSGRKLLMGSSYLLMLLGLVMISKIASTVIDNQFNAAVELTVEGKDARTAFYGGYFSFLNALSFVVQFFFTSAILRFLGVGTALWILPVGLTLGGLTSVFYPVLLTGLFLKTFDGSVNYSIQQAAREVLYLPISSEIRYRIKPINDMLGFRIAKSLAGVYIVLAAPLLKIPDKKLSILVLFLLPFWFFMAWKMRAGYSQMLRQNIDKLANGKKPKESRRAEDILKNRFDEKTPEIMKAFLEHPSSYDRKLSAVACALYLAAEGDSQNGRKYIQDIMRHESVDIEKASGGAPFDGDLEALEEVLLAELKKGASQGNKSEILKNFPDEILMKLGAVIQNADKGLSAKRRAVKMLEVVPKQNAMDLLIARLAGTQHHTLRFVLVKALNRLHGRNKELEINRFLIKNEVSRESSLYLNLKKIKSYYEQEKPDAGEAENTYGITILQALMDESIERIFCFLDLLYPHEMIQTIYDRIADHSQNDQVRSHAVELLNNTLETDVLILVQKVLEEHGSEYLSENQATEILRGFISSQDQWFYFASCMIAEELKLKERCSDFKSLNWQEYAFR